MRCLYQEGTRTMPGSHTTDQQGKLLVSLKNRTSTEAAAVRACAVRVHGVLRFIDGLYAGRPCLEADRIAAPEIWRDDPGTFQPQAEIDKRIQENRTG